MGDRLAEIRARLNAASPGPWRNAGGLGLGYWIVAEQPWSQIAAAYGDSQNDGHGVANAELIAHAPDDIAFLIAEVDRLRTRRGRG